MATDARTRIVTLVVLVGILTGVLAWQFWPAASSPATAGPSPRPNPSAAAGNGEPRTLDVNLAALARQGVAPRPTGRDPFGFRATPPPAPPPVAVTPPVQSGGDGPPGGAALPPPPPPPPPITLKFIGLIVDGPDQRKIAVLSDGKFVFHGREGDIIEGRFRVVRIGDESMQMEHIDGRGRQTIRLSGS